METSANYVGVGAFVLVCVIGLVVAIMWLAGVQYSQEYAYYQAYFKGPVTGLGTGTITRFNGIEVGRYAHRPDPAAACPQTLSERRLLFRERGLWRLRRRGERQPR